MTHRWPPWVRRGSGDRREIASLDAPDRYRMQETAELLAHVDDDAESPIRSEVRFARELHTLGAEHLRLADEFEAAARHHRLAAQRASRRAWVALAGARPEGGAEASGIADEADREPFGSDGPGDDAAGGDDRDDTAATSAGNDADAGTGTADDAGVDVRVRILGSLEVRAEDRPVAWAGTRHRALFQYLLLHPGPVHREELMELLWPGHSYDSARNNLNGCVYGLRRSLQSAGSTHDYVVYHEACYSLNTVDLRWVIDRDEFLLLAGTARSLARQNELPRAATAATDATDLYRGPLFQDDPAVDWFAAERRSLREQHLELLELEAVWRLDLADLDGARRAGQRVLTDDPCRESAHRLLMRCYAHQHQGDLLARQFMLCVTTLHKELGIGPTAETVRLHDELTRPR